MCGLNPQSADRYTPVAYPLTDLAIWKIIKFHTNKNHQLKVILFVLLCHIMEVSHSPLMRL